MWLAQSTAMRTLPRAPSALPANPSAPEPPTTTVTITSPAIEDAFAKRPARQDSELPRSQGAAQPASVGLLGLFSGHGRAARAAVLGAAICTVAIGLSVGANVAEAAPRHARTDTFGRTHNVAPSISGAPAASVVAGEPYSFKPNVTDPDHQLMRFSITNKPAWASFSRLDGMLSGTPSAGSAGTYSGITIRVSDGHSTSSLPPFAITVHAAQPTLHPPSISGTPASTVVAGQPYSFAPTANDQDGDALTYSVTNLPTWASFDATTGRVFGTPTSANVGHHDGVTISVSDGSSTSLLPPFGIDVTAAPLATATLSWTPPTTNLDGTPLTNLAGYEVIHDVAPIGPSPGDEVIPVNDSSATGAVVGNLAPGTHHFTVKAVNSAGLKSEPSNMATKVVP